MIAVLYGEDEFGAAEALEELKRELDSDDQLAENTARIDGATARPDELLVACQTVPFLSTRRLIVVDGLLARFEPRARRGRGRGQAGLGPWQDFVDALPSLPESTALVFLDGKIAAGNPMLKALRPAADVKDFGALKQNEVAGWVVERAKRYDLNLDGRAVATLASLVGNHLRLLDSELRKLGIYAGGRTVTQEDVRSLVTLAREPNAFAMADAVIEGRTRDALDLMQRLMADGEPVQRLLGVLARQYRLLMLAKELQAKGVRPPEIGTRLHVPGFVLQRLLKQAPVYTDERLRRAYKKLLRTDLSVKRGVYDGETAFQLLLVELSARQGGPTPRGGRQGYSRPRGGRAPSPPRPAKA